jgi:ubiquinone/menaquinone biosynthesis C-methylase UbiE
MTRRISRPGVREGYDLWAESYDRTPNPLVALDRRYTVYRLGPRSGERILDAGCGTGGNLRRIARRGARPIGIDFSRGMLRIATRSLPGVPLVQADLNRDLPIRRERFDALLCALVSEHLRNIGTFFLEAFSVLRRGGRLVFSAFHPEMAAAGVEANLQIGGTEYRLGAERYSVDDYLNRIHDAGFCDLHWSEHGVDAQLIDQMPRAGKYLGRPLLLIIQATRSE